MNETPNYYAIIPADVRYSKDITNTAKLLYAEITALANKNGECWASNKYFSNLYGIETETISRTITSLIENNFLERKIIYKEGTKKIENRVLIPIDKKINTYCQKNQGGIDKNVKENNTSINNIYIYYEKIFGRTLNGIEYETLTNWLEKKSYEQIKEAIDSTAKSNIDNLKYVEKVLFSKKNNSNKKEKTLEEIFESLEV